jgi:hypothetical protein
MSARESLVLFLSVLFLFPTRLHGASSDASEWQWFSDAPRELKALLADPRETQLRVGYLRQGNKNSYLDLGLGGHLGVARKETKESAFSLQVRALAMGRFQFGSKSFDYQNGDFIGGLASSYRHGQDAFEVFLSHQSSHLGDDVIAKGRSFSNYSFESARILYSHDFTSELWPSLRLYSGLAMKARAVPSRIQGKFMPIIGGDWYFLSRLPDLFVAADLRLKEENDFAPNFSFIVGYELGQKIQVAAQVQRRQRFFLELYNGYSNQGQFDQEREFSLFAGIGFTL